MQDLARALWDRHDNGGSRVLMAEAVSMGVVLQGRRQSVDSFIFSFKVPSECLYQQLPRMSHLLHPPAVFTFFFLEMSPCPFGPTCHLLTLSDNDLPKINTTNCASFEVRTDSDDGGVLFC